MIPQRNASTGIPLLTGHFGFTFSRLVIFTLFPGVVFLCASMLGQGTAIDLLHFAGVALPFLVTSMHEKGLLLSASPRPCSRTSRCT